MKKIDLELKKLEKQILSIKPTGDIFQTFSLETSLGKTTTAINSIVKYLKNPFGNKKNRFVLVTKFANEGIDIARKIFDETKGEYSILAYNHSNKLMKEIDTKGEYTTNSLKGLNKASVVIITHSTYVHVCKANTIKDKENPHYILREILKNYKTLIIDEEINLVKETFGTLDNLKLERLNKLFENLENNYCRDLFVGIKDNLNKIINIHKELSENGEISSKFMCRIKEDRITKALGKSSFNGSELLIQKIIKLVGGIDELSIKRVEKSKKIKLGSKSDVIKELEDISLCIKMLEDESAIYMPSNSKTSGTLAFYDENIEYFKLKNNIYMDASACFNKIYELSGEFNIIETERLIDHSNCTIVANVVNTSSSRKRDIKATKEFNKGVLEEIKVLNSEVLIINSKDECESMKDMELEIGIKESKIEYTNFQNMRGRNNWKDYKYCYITHTPNLPFSLYIFMKEYYSKSRASDKEMICQNSIHNQYRFINSEDITSVYYSDLASSFYQGIKRVCRSRNPKGEFHIYTHVGVPMSILRKQLLNVEWELIKEVKTKKGSRAEEIKNWIENEWNGEPIKTKDILEKLNITQKKFDKIKENNSNLKDFIKTFEVKRGWYAK